MEYQNLKQIFGDKTQLDSPTFLDLEIFEK